MTRRIKDRTELLAFLTACVLSRMAVTPFHFRTTASGAIIEPPVFLTILVAAIVFNIGCGLHAVHCEKKRWALAFCFAVSVGIVTYIFEVHP